MWQRLGLMRPTGCCIGRAEAVAPHCHVVLGRDLLVKGAWCGCEAERVKAHVLHV